VDPRCSLGSHGDDILRGIDAIMAQADLMWTRIEQAFHWTTNLVVTVDGDCAGGSLTSAHWRWSADNGCTTRGCIATNIVGGKIAVGGLRGEMPATGTRHHCGCISI
jgi:hypothetical protein